MKSLFAVCLLCCLLLLSVSPVFSAGLWLFEDGSPEMGHATAGSAALGQNASTAFSNPAAMTRLDRSQMMVGLLAIYADARFDAEEAEFGGGDGGNAGGWIPAGSFAYVHDYSPDLKFGIWLGSYFGLGLDYGSDWAGRYYVQEADFVTMAANPGVGYRLNDQWSIGAGFSVVYGELEQKTAINNPASDDGQLKIDTDDWALGYNLGVLYEPTQTTRFGLTYRSKVDLEFEDTAKVSGLGPILSGVGNLLNLIGSEVDMEMSVPASVNFSAYHEFTERFALLGSITWQDSSEFGKSTISISSETTTNLTADRNFDDAWTYALGCKYRLAEPWLLSLGIAYSESLVDDDDRTVDLPVDRQWRYAVGIEYDLSEDTTIGAAYAYLDAGDAPVNQNRGALAGALAGDFSTNELHFFGINLNRRF